MFLTKLKMAMVVLMAVGTLTAGAVALAQQSEAGGQSAREGEKARPRLKFEIRTWKDGKQSGTPIVVEATGEGPYQVETADAVIEIRPRGRRDQRGQEEDARRLDQQELNLKLLQQRLMQRQNAVVKELNRLPETAKLQQAEVNVLRQIEELLKQAKEMDAKSQPKPAPEKELRPDQSELKLDRPQPSIEQERRLEQLEWKIDQILKALEGSKAAKDQPIDPFRKEGGARP